MGKRKFDTRMDARILMALSVLEQLDNLTKMSKVPGIRKSDAIQILERLTSILNKIRDSRMPKHELLFSGLFRAYNNLLSSYISAMGTKWFQIAKSRDDRNAKLLRFILLNLRSLGSRLKKTEDGILLGAFNVVFVRVLDKKPHPYDKNLSVYYCTDLECIYEVASDYNLDKNDAVAFVHTWPIEVKKFWSEGMFLRNKECVLFVTNPDMVGSRVSLNEICDEDRAKLEEMVLEKIEDYMIL
ncbi:MAG: hypothetical protein Q6363_009940 [Candidatus Njordarchaeota archaeon]